MIVPYRPEHLSKIETHNPEHAALAKTMAPEMAYLAHEGFARTIKTDDGKVLAVAGVCTMAGNEVFIFPSKWIERRPKTFWRDLVGLVGMARKVCGQLTAISKDTELARRFFTHLGFVLTAPPERPECVGMLGWVFIVVVTLGLDRFFHYFLPAPVGYQMAEPATIAIVTAVTAATTAAASVGFGVNSMLEQQDAADAAKKLENQQADELKNEQAARAAEAATEATSGQTFGFSNIPSHSILSGLGYGASGGGKTSGSGRGSITGMGGGT